MREGGSELYGRVAVMASRKYLAPPPQHQHDAVEGATARETQPRHSSEVPSPDNTYEALLVLEILNC